MKRKMRRTARLVVNGFSESEALKYIESTLEGTGVSLHELRQKKRTQHLVDLRYDIMLGLNEKGLGNSQIGDLLNRDHSTVSYALKTYTKAEHCTNDQKPTESNLLALLKKEKREITSLLSSINILIEHEENKFK